MCWLCKDTGFVSIELTSRFLIVPITKRVEYTCPICNDDMHPLYQLWKTNDQQKEKSNGNPS